MKRVVLLATALFLGACDHEGPTVFDARFDGPGRDGSPPADAAPPDSPPAPDAPPPDAASTD